MITRLPENQYQELIQRVREGKEILRDHWGSKDPDIRKWVTLWFSLSDQLITQMRIRGIFEEKKEELSPNRIKDETPDEYIERLQLKFIREGKFTGVWVKPWLQAYQTKKGGKKKNVRSKSESYYMFESS